MRNLQKLCSKALCLRSVEKKFALDIRFSATIFSCPCLVFLCPFLSNCCCLVCCCCSLEIFSLVLFFDTAFFFFGLLVLGDVGVVIVIVVVVVVEVGCGCCRFWSGGESSTLKSRNIGSARLEWNGQSCSHGCWCWCGCWCGVFVVVIVVGVRQRVQVTLESFAEF